jgi:hypothetical protein
MNSLSDFKVLLDKHNIKYEPNGWYILIPNGDRWTLSHDQLYLNGNPQSKQELSDYLKAGPKAPARVAKKIKPKQGYEDDSSSIEVDFGR